MKVYSFEISGGAVVTDGIGVEVGVGLGVAGTSVAVGVTVGVFVTGGAAVATGGSVKIGVGEKDEVLVGVEEDSRVAQAAMNNAAVMHKMKYLPVFLLSFFITRSFR